MCAWTRLQRIEVELAGQEMAGPMRRGRYEYEDIIPNPPARAPESLHGGWSVFVDVADGGSTGSQINKRRVSLWTSLVTILRDT